MTKVLPHDAFNMCKARAGLMTLHEAVEQFEENEECEGKRRGQQHEVGGLKGKGKSQRVVKATEYLPVLQYDSTLLAKTNGTLGNTMVNYSTYLDDTSCNSLSPLSGTHLPISHPFTSAIPFHFPSLPSHSLPVLPPSSATFLPFPLPFSPPFLPSHHPLSSPPQQRAHLSLLPSTSVYPYYVALKLGSQKQEFSMALNAQLRHTCVPCDCLHCASSRKGSKPFSTLSSTTLQCISCADQRCQGGVESSYYGCNTQGLPNYLNFTGVLPGDDALCVFDVYAESYDYSEADTVADSFLKSAGHVVEDTVYLTAPGDTEAHRSIIFGCGVNQQGYWGMHGRSTGSWTAGGVLGLAQGSPFLEQLTAGTNFFAVCLDEPTPTNKTSWDGKVQQHTGSSHPTIGAVGLPAGASYSTLSYPTGLPYSRITLTTAPRTLNMTDDPANIDLNKTSFMPADASEDDVPGFFFLPENKNKEEDPFSTFPTIDIAFLSPDDSSATSHFYLKRRKYLAQPPFTRVSLPERLLSRWISEYHLGKLRPPTCHSLRLFPNPMRPYSTFLPLSHPSLLATRLCIEPGLFNKYLFFNYTNNSVGWLQAPQCGAEPLLPPPSPPPSGGTSSKGATRSLSLVAAAVGVVATSTALLALALL
ncbi:unnamed protein product [Closterium sp. NIES-64]|nr:unnamed protein product [Closterium sp. NIES-64]